VEVQRHQESQVKLDTDLTQSLESMEAWRHMPVDNIKPADIPVKRILMLLAKVVRFNRGGWTASERREIAADLLALASDMVD